MGIISLVAEWEITRLADQIVGLKPKLVPYPFRVRANHHLKWWFVIVKIIKNDIIFLSNFL